MARPQPQRRSRRARNQEPEIVPVKSDEEVEDDSDDGNSSSRASKRGTRGRRTRQRSSRPSSPEESESSDDQKSKDEDSSDTSDDDVPLSKLLPQKKASTRKRAATKSTEKTEDDDESSSEADTGSDSRKRPQRRGRSARSLGNSDTGESLQTNENDSSDEDGDSDTNQKLSKRQTTQKTPTRRGRSRRQEKESEATPKRRGRSSKKSEASSDDEGETSDNDSDEEKEEDTTRKTPKRRGRSRKTMEISSNDEDQPEVKARTSKRQGRSAPKKASGKEDDKDSDGESIESTRRSSRRQGKSAGKKASGKNDEDSDDESTQNNDDTKTGRSTRKRRRGVGGKDKETDEEDDDATDRDDTVEDESDEESGSKQKEEVAGESGDDGESEEESGRSKRRRKPPQKPSSGNKVDAPQNTKRKQNTVDQSGDDKKDEKSENESQPTKRARVEDKDAQDQDGAESGQQDKTSDTNVSHVNDQSKTPVTPKQPGPVEAAIAAYLQSRLSAEKAKASEKPQAAKTSMPASKIEMKGVGSGVGKASAIPPSKVPSKGAAIESSIDLKPKTQSMEPEGNAGTPQTVEKSKLQTFPTENELGLPVSNASQVQATMQLNASAVDKKTEKGVDSADSKGKDCESSVADSNPEIGTKLNSPKMIQQVQAVGKRESDPKRKAEVLTDDNKSRATGVVSMQTKLPSDESNLQSAAQAQADRLDKNDRTLQSVPKEKPGHPRKEDGDESDEFHDAHMELPELPTEEANKSTESRQEAPISRSNSAVQSTALESESHDAVVPGAGSVKEEEKSLVGTNDTEGTASPSKMDVDEDELSATKEIRNAKGHTQSAPEEAISATEPIELTPSLDVGKAKHVVKKRLVSEITATPFTASGTSLSDSFCIQATGLYGYDPNKLKRVKAILYSTGSRVHRGHGFERLFSQYWDAVSLQLSNRLSSHESHQCSLAVKAFLKSPKLRKLHNKFIFSIMKRAIKSFAPFAEVSRHIPSSWHGRVKTIDRTHYEVEESQNEESSGRKRPDTPELKPVSIYGEAWERSTEDANPFSFSTSDVKKNQLPSSWIPGALVVDPLVRDKAESKGMRVSENAVWLLVVAVREHAKNVMKNTLTYKKALQEGKVPEAVLQYPNVLATTKHPKRDNGSEKPEAATPSDSTNAGAGSKLPITALDIFASSASMPVGTAGSMGGSLSSPALERCLYSAYDSLPPQPGRDFVKVQNYIAGEIISQARYRKLMAPPEKPKAESSLHKVSRPPAHRSSVKKSPHGVMNDVSLQPQPSNVPPTHASNVSQVRNQNEIVNHVDVPGTSSRAESQNPVVDAKEVPKGLGRGGKNLAALMKRESEVEPAVDTGDDIQDAEDNSLTGPARRGKGFGTKNLAAMRARSSQSDTASPEAAKAEDERNDTEKESTIANAVPEEKAAPVQTTAAEGVATDLTSEMEKETKEESTTQPTVFKESAGSKDLAVTKDAPLPSTSLTISDDTKKGEDESNVESSMEPITKPSDGSETPSTTTPNTCQTPASSADQATKESSELAGITPQEMKEDNNVTASQSLSHPTTKPSETEETETEEAEKQKQNAESPPKESNGKPKEEVVTTDSTVTGDDSTKSPKPEEGGEKKENEDEVNTAGEPVTKEDETESAIVATSEKEEKDNDKESTAETTGDSEGQDETPKPETEK